MFDLQLAIADWRDRITREGLRERDLLDELENHLREDIASQTQSGADFDTAFTASVERIGPASALKSEFRKVPMKNWNRPLAITAWTLYAVSFFVPAYMEGWGWQCAMMQKVFWSSATDGHWGSILYELLTLANILMLASPFLILRIGHNLGSVKWFRIMTLVATLLVWWFLGLLLSENAGELKVGAYMWGSSFILIHLATYKLPARKPVYA